MTANNAVDGSADIPLRRSGVKPPAIAKLEQRDSMNKLLHFAPVQSFFEPEIPAEAFNDSGIFIVNADTQSFFIIKPVHDIKPFGTKAGRHVGHLDFSGTAPDERGLDVP